MAHIHHTNPKPEEAKVLALIDRMNAEAPAGTTFVIYADTTEEGTDVYGIGMMKKEPGQKFSTPYAPLHLYPTAAQVLASITN